MEKEIQTVKVKNNLTHPDARKLVLSRIPRPGVSFSAATNPKTVASIGAQTELSQSTVIKGIEIESRRNLDNRNQTINVNAKKQFPLQKISNPPSSSKKATSSKHDTKSLKKVKAKPVQLKKLTQKKDFLKNRLNIKQS